jgi:hypothetical protein
VNINFLTPQNIPGDDVFVTVGSESTLSAINFGYDDNITMAIAISTFRISHFGTSGDTITVLYEFAYFNSSGVVQAYNNSEGNDTHILINPSSTDYQMGSQGLIGNGSTRIASIRLRVKHNQSDDVLNIKDSLQITALCVSDESASSYRTFSSGTIS